MQVIYRVKPSAEYPGRTWTREYVVSSDNLNDAGLTLGQEVKISKTIQPNFSVQQEFNHAEQVYLAISYPLLNGDDFTDSSYAQAKEIFKNPTAMQAHKILLATKFK